MHIQYTIWAKDTFGKSTVPKWNFHKILINKNGKVEDTFASFTGPMSNKIINKIRSRFYKVIVQAVICRNTFFR